MAVAGVQVHGNANQKPFLSPMVLELSVGGVSVAGATLATNPIGKRTIKHNVNYQEPLVPWLCFDGFATAPQTLRPHDVVKVRMQLAQRAGSGLPLGMLRTGVDVIKQDGFSGLYRGVTPAVFRGLTYGGIRLGFYRPICDSLTRLASTSGRPAETSLGTKVAAGMMSGALAALVTSPTELIKTRLQAKGNTLKGPVDVLLQVAAADGVHALWRGAGPGMVRAALLTAAQCATYDEAKQAVLRTSGWQDGVLTQFTASCLAGLVVATVTNPPDVVKTYMFVGVKTGAASSSSGMWATAVAIASQEGPRAFMKGWFANWARMGPQTTITFMMAEALRNAAGMQKL